MAKMLEKLFSEEGYFVELLQGSRNDAGSLKPGVGLRKGNIKNFINVHPHNGTGSSLPNKSGGQKWGWKMHQVLHDLWEFPP